jgi:small subunit ribosomal protein S2
LAGRGFNQEYFVRIDVEGTSEPVIEASQHEASSPKETSVGKRKKNSSGSKIAAVIKESERPARAKVEINLQTLLEAGAHFGHQTSRWSPAMAPYIYTSRNGIHIINLPKTVQSWERARKMIESVVGRGGSVLFVGTKKQAQEALIEEAQRCGAFFVARRWLGGMMTNFQTIRKSIDRMNKLGTTIAEDEALLASGGHPKFTKKERLMMSREREKLEFSLGGIKDMHAPPQLLFVVDIKREEIAVKEARRLDIPVVALVDTNCDPKTVTCPIPSNDDGTRAIRLFCAAVSDAVLDGRKIAGERKQAEPVERKHSSRHAAVSADSASGQDSASTQAVPAEETVVNGESTDSVEDVSKNETPVES